MNIYNNNEHKAVSLLLLLRTYENFSIYYNICYTSDLDGCAKISGVSKCYELCASV